MTENSWVPELWMAAPFAGLLLSIAVLPLAAKKFWHSLKNQALVSLAFSIPIILLCLKNSPHALWGSLEEYISFVILLGSLFIVSGGLWIEGGFKSTALANTLLLGTGAVLSNFVGTTGASMILIRPLLRANAHRKHHAYLPIFFIFLVGNIGGALTPLGDPPLFLGFLRGVPFFWTLKLFPLWLMTVGTLLGIFYCLDSYIIQKHSRTLIPHIPDTFRLNGKRNLLCFAVIVGAVFIPSPYRSQLLLVTTLVSLWITPKRYREANDFHYSPILEVATIFLGIFITMVPALLLLQTRGAELGLTRPWQFFWATGCFSSFLDNAPTYLTFATLGKSLRLGGPFFGMPEPFLLAISAGAVFFGACTYIGNAPNFMIRSIAEHMDWKMPSFFGYMLWSVGILFPLFLLLTVVFF
ncbi:MAG TPA: sodium:proton antiporter [Candidatus Omnitrophota bacterium]|nr:sodium:proton antiporter [Candidatus Omnitrophota bacterium]HPS36323.1 sodium:proton antiporter [Candidatus Omnitrophota bacterium]